MFPPQRSNSAPTPRFPQHLEQYILPADKVVIQQTIMHPELRTAIQCIAGYARHRIESAINKQILEEFLSNGITAFGTRVKDAKVLIPRFLEDHQELKDVEPIRCFTKITFYFSCLAAQGLMAPA